MKKLTGLLLIAGLMAFVACGPSAEEKATAEKQMQDSIAAADAQMKAAQEAAASTVDTTAMMPDSTAMAADTTAKK